MSKQSRRVLPIAAAMVACAWAAAAGAQTKLLRFPDISGDSVVFCYAGDLWKAPATGGRRDAADRPSRASSCFRRFSPDGKWIAFTGQYDGDEQVYVIPSEGGVAEAAHLLPGARPAGAALGVRQPGVRLDAATARACSSAPCATATAAAIAERALHRSTWTAACR